MKNKAPFAIGMVCLVSRANSQTYTLSACATKGNLVNCLRDGTTVSWTTVTAASPTSRITTTKSSISVTSTSSAIAAASVTAITDCHMHETVQYCVAGSTEYIVYATSTDAEALPTAYTGCHAHGSELFCLTSDGDEILAEAKDASAGENRGEHDSTSTTSSSGSSSSAGVSCHFHAGVEHCVGAGESEHSESKDCGIVERNYNVPLRIGLLFVILATSALGVFLPIFIASTPRYKYSGFVLMILKQFGTGVILSTALVHLFTHAELMFANECLGVLRYEATAAAIVMAGIVSSFLLDYIGSRVLLWRIGKVSAFASASMGSTTQCEDTKSSTAHAPTSTQVAASNAPSESREQFKVIILEAGIIFHSLLIGLTLVVAGDSFFTALFVVILFHQMFEGLALGSRIGELSIGIGRKAIMAIVFSLITPIGMSIGIGVLNQFNGNDPSTAIALGTLNAFSAGILLWVGLVEMLAHDWIHGHLASAPMSHVLPAGLSLNSGLILMSVLGKWA